MCKRKTILGISVCNPFDVEENYINQTVDYAIKKGYDHIQFIGPIHDSIKGNIDGMAFYHKYAQFNHEKDEAYIKMATRVINVACEKANIAGIKTYVWHHELDLPSEFKKAFPNALNKYQDIEVSSPEVKDFLEYKIVDFFEQYPKIDGIILTLHETKVPLLKLKDQKLDKVERVKYVTKILYDTCKRLGKELIVRTFASIEEDYILMTQAYEEISREMMIMDKWTQFDWSLCLPHNAFYQKIQKNPLFVEADVFGEFFGNGWLPLMLKKHITEKYEYCETFEPKGYCARIDRACGQIPFGDVNAVNMDIMHACLTGNDVDEAIDTFFIEKYGEAGLKVRQIMESTEDVLRKIIYLNGYYYTELSVFPSLNHSKNHFYFEVMRDAYKLVSGEWFIPKDWQRGTIEGLLDEKQEAQVQAEKLYEDILSLKDTLVEDEYEALCVKFYNLALTAKVWHLLTYVFLYYTKYFEMDDDAYQTKLYEALYELEALDQQGKRELGEQFYCLKGNVYTGPMSDKIPKFIEEVKQSFKYEKSVWLKLRHKENLIDYIVCGGGYEGHEIQKEVNFSDTLMINNKLCRIPDSCKGLEWCAVNGHGWFSYLLKVKPQVENLIRIHCTSNTFDLELQITVGDLTKEIHTHCEGDTVIDVPYVAAVDEKEVRIRFDKIAGNTPCIYLIEVIA